jgi:hypothetical protein
MLLVAVENRRALIGVCLTHGVCLQGPASRQVRRDEM